MTTTPKTVYPRPVYPQLVFPRPLPPQVRWDLGAFCPVDDTLLQVEPAGWSCPACGAAWDHAGDHGWWLTNGTDLAARLAAEDALQEAGLVDVGQRSTCHSCRAWVTFDHTAAHASDVASDVASGDVPTANAGSRSGRRAVIVAAVLVETSLLCQLAGYLTRDRWAHLLPAGLAWWIASGLAAAAAGAAAITVGWRLAQRWWGGWWPYRHNQVLGTAAELGWDLPAETHAASGAAEGGVPDER